MSDVTSGVTHETALDVAASVELESDPGVIAGVMQGVTRNRGEGGGDACSGGEASDGEERRGAGGALRARTSFSTRS